MAGWTNDERILLEKAVRGYRKTLFSLQTLGPIVDEIPLGNWQTCNLDRIEFDTEMKPDSTKYIDSLFPTNYFDNLFTSPQTL